MSEVQAPVGSLIQPKAPGPSAPAGSLEQPPPAVVRSVSTWSSEGAGRLGHGGANIVPWVVAVSHSQAETVKAVVVATRGGPHSACAQAYTLVPLYPA